MENFFSSGVTGQVNGFSYFYFKIFWLTFVIFEKKKIMGRNVLYPDFTMETTRAWWKDALNRFINTDQVIRFDGIYLVKLLFNK